MILSCVFVIWTDTHGFTRLGGRVGTNFSFWPDPFDWSGFFARLGMAFPVPPGWDMLTAC